MAVVADSQASLPLIRSKVVLLGAPGVGKTSLIRRFVHQTFSEQHLTTLGVKVDRKTVSLPDANVVMLLWDMHGETADLEVPAAYLRGASAVLLVLDATRIHETLTTCLTLHERLLKMSPNAVVQWVINKADLIDDWTAVADAMVAAGLNMERAVQTSALDGHGVEAVFMTVASGIAAGGLNRR